MFILHCLTKPGWFRFPYREPSTDVLSQPDGFTAPYETSTNNTSVYRDTVTSQRAIVGMYVFLPLWMALLVPMVSRNNVADAWVGPSRRVHAEFSLNVSPPATVSDGGNDRCLEMSEPVLPAPTLMRQLHDWIGNSYSKPGVVRRNEVVDACCPVSTETRVFDNKL